MNSILDLALTRSTGRHTSTPLMGTRSSLPWAFFFSALMSTGCGKEPQKTVKQPVTARASATYIEKVATGRPNLDKYRRPESGTVPILRLGTPRSKEPKGNDTKQQKLTMAVTITGSGVASGGSASDWEGLKPRERFFKVAYVKPNSDPSKLGETHYFRMKTKNPKAVVRLLGQVVRIKGRWITQSTQREASTAYGQMPQAIDLRPRKGQDLVEAVKKARKEFIDKAVDGEKAADENNQPAIFERQGIMRATQEIMPLFHADTVTPLKSSSGLKPKRKTRRPGPRQANP